MSRSKEFKRLRSARKLAGSTNQPDDEAGDAGAYRTLEVQIPIVTGGTSGGSIALQHPATNEPGSFRDLPDTSIQSDTTGDFITVEHFLRYIRFVTTGTVSGNPVVRKDICTGHAS